MAAGVGDLTEQASGLLAPPPQPAGVGAGRPQNGLRQPEIASATPVCPHFELAAQQGKMICGQNCRSISLT
jgi:hypothetical protein